MFSFDVKVFPLQNPKGKTKAFAHLVVDGVMELRDLSVVDGSKGLFVSMPRRPGKDRDGNPTYYDRILFHGEQGETIKKDIVDAVLAAFHDAVAGKAPPSARRENTQESVPLERPGRRPLW
jgi:DNA-binding cell septation regulator SpoVG